MLFDNLWSGKHRRGKASENTGMSRRNAVLLIISFVGMLMKNLVFQSFVSGDNSYVPSPISPARYFSIAFLLNIAVAAILFAGVFLFSDKYKCIYAFAANIAVTAVYIGDTMYFRCFNSMPSALMLKLVGYVSHTKSSLFKWTSWFDLLFFVDIAVFIAVAYFTRHERKCIPVFTEKFGKRLIKFISAVTCAAAIIVFIPVLNTFGLCTDKYDTVYDAPYTIDDTKYFTVIGYHFGDVIDIISEKKKLSTEIDAEDYENICEFYEWHKQETDTSLIPERYKELEGIYKDKNLIVIQVEALENFVIGLEIDGKEITPNLNRFAKGGLYFDNIYEQVKCGNSSDYDFMLMTSVLPPDKVSFFNFYKNNSMCTINNVLGKKNYRSTYFNSSNDSVWDYQPVIEGTLGFDKSVLDYDRSEVFNNYISDRTLLEQVYNYFDGNEIRSEDDPNGKFYTHIVLTSSHTPFELPEEYNVIDCGSFNDTPAANYVNAVHYVDEQIGMFISKLREGGFLEDSVVLITGDHNGLHKYFPKETAKLVEKGCDWMSAVSEKEDSTLPLIIYSEASEIPNAAMKVSDPAGQIDILPTLMYLMGEDVSDCGFMGRNIFLPDSFAVLPDGRIIGSDNRLMTAPWEENDEDLPKADPAAEKRYKNIYCMYDVSDTIIKNDYLRIFNGGAPFKPVDIRTRDTSADKN